MVIHLMWESLRGLGPFAPETSPGARLPGACGVAAAALARAPFLGGTASAPSTHNVGASLPPPQSTTRRTKRAAHDDEALAPSITTRDD